MTRLFLLLISALITVAGALALAAFLWPLQPPTSTIPPNGDVARGAYLARMAGCIACHTNASAGGAPLAGGLALQTDFGTFYSANLAVPKRRRPNGPDRLAGKQLFYASGCASCHTPKYVTSRNAERAAHRFQLIWPYTDMLLHDMGEGLSDHRPMANATATEWRTAPLWGIGLTPTVNGHSYYLHDGRARNLTEAILWHGGEALAARDAFAALTREERAQLLTFLESL